MPNVQTYLTAEEYKKLQNKILRLGKTESAYLKDLVLRDLQEPPRKTLNGVFRQEAL